MIIKAIISELITVPQKNEPYKTEESTITCVRVEYSDGGFDEFFNIAFGIKASDNFYDILPDDCEVEIKTTRVIDCDEYYDNQSFKNACFNRGQDNPYQLPKWTV